MNTSSGFRWQRRFKKNTSFSAHLSEVQVLSFFDSILLLQIIRVTANCENDLESVHVSTQFSSRRIKIIFLKQLKVRFACKRLELRMSNFTNIVSFWLSFSSISIWIRQFCLNVIFPLRSYYFNVRFELKLKLFIFKNATENPYWNPHVLSISIFEWSEYHFSLQMHVISFFF